MWSSWVKRKGTTQVMCIAKLKDGPKSVTTGMFVTRRPRGAKPQVKGTQGPAGRPTPWLAGHTLSQFRPRHGAYAPKAVCKSIQCPKVGGNWEEWLADHVDDHPAVHHL
jgi:hypothetical protein